jgi:uncharacterized membrane protein YfcA
MTLTQMLVIAGAFLVAGVAKGAVGLGLAPIAIGLLTFAVSLEQALALMVLPTLATNIWQAIFRRGFLALLRRFWTMIAAAVAALTFGTLGSPKAAGWVGVILVIYGLLALTTWRPALSRTTERWANPLIGMASGAVAGFTGVAAVPFLPYMQSLDIERNDLVQALGIMFLFTVGTLSLPLALQGAFDSADLKGGMAAVVPTFIGFWVGQKVRNAVSPETFRRLFLSGILIVGLHMAASLL